MIKPLLYLSVFIFSPIAQAENSNLGEMITDIRGQIGEAGPFLTLLSALIGLVLIFVGIMKLREHNNQARENARVYGVVIIMVGSLFTTLGSVVFVFKDTLIGTASNVNSAQSSRFDPNQDTVDSTILKFTEGD